MAGYSITIHFGVVVVTNKKLFDKAGFGVSRARMVRRMSVVIVEWIIVCCGGCCVKGWASFVGFSLDNFAGGGYG